MFDFSYTNILHSNVINFLIMIGFIALIIKRLDVKSVIDDNHKKIVEKINKSNDDVKDALKKYEKAKKELDNVHIETDMIVENASKTLENIEEKAQNELNEIKEHLEKILLKDIDREVQNTYNDITSSVSKASIALSYEKIKQTLNQNPQLHQKYIDECINSIDGLSI